MSKYKINIWCRQVFINHFGTAFTLNGFIFIKKTLDHRAHSLTKCKLSSLPYLQNRRAAIIQYWVTIKKRTINLEWSNLKKGSRLKTILNYCHELDQLDSHILDNKIHDLMWYCNQQQQEYISVYVCEAEICFYLRTLNHFKADPWGMSNFTDNVTTFRIVFRGLEHIFQCRNVSIYYEIRQFTSEIFESSNRKSGSTKLNSKNSKLCPLRTLEIRVSVLMNPAQEK